MFEPLVRDGAARVAQWELGGRDLTTPLVLYVDTPRVPAPGFARAVLARREPDADAPWVRDAGSRFTTADDDADDVGQPALTIPRDLPYYPAGGVQLLEAADEANREAAGAESGGRVFVAAAPSGAVPAGAEVVVMAGAAALLQDPFRFAEHALAVRERAGYQRLLYAPGAGLPHEVALLAYAGVDLLDSSAAALAARTGQYLTAEGPLPADAVEERPCPCPACATDLQGYEWLRDHAYHALDAEMARVRTAIRRGRLRELVDQRVRSRPELVAHLRRFDHDHYGFFAERAPVLREGKLFVTSAESLDRPEVARFRRRVREWYRPPGSARVLLLLPCSARKPYSTSRTHRVLASATGVANAGAVHEAIVTSPLGVVPRELEYTYPAAHYDLPVTGQWSADEETMIRDGVKALLERGAYDEVVVHLDETEMGIVAPALPDFVYTVEGDNPLAQGSLNTLRSTLGKLTGDLERVSRGAREADDMVARARYQFGDAAEALMEGVVVKGRYPYLKAFDGDGEQLAMHVPDRGLLSITLTGGERLAAAGANRVSIEDFRPKGSIFAVGVTDADAGIRVEDEVVVVHGDEVRAVGRAAMPGVEMREQPRGEAVKVRHYA